MRRIQIKFRTKLFITYLLLVSLPLFILGYLCYEQYVRSLERSVGEYLPVILKQVNSNLDQYITDIMDVPDVLMNSSEVLAILRRTQPSQTSTAEQDAFFMNGILSSTVVNGKNLDIIAAFVQSGDRVFSSSRMNYEGDAFLKKRNPFHQEMDLQGEPLVLPPDRLRLFFEGNQPYLSVYTQLYDSENMKPLCTVLLIVNFTEIERIVQQIPLSVKRDILIKNEIGQIIYHSTNQSVSETIETNVIPENGTIIQSGVILSSVTSDYTKWTLSAGSPIKELAKETIYIRNYTIAIFTVCLVLGVIASAYISQTVTNPIRSLQRLMRTVEKGNFEVAFPVTQTDEIGELGSNFNRMVVRIQELVQKVYQVEIRQREAELSALQSQISPHFLYNTLESIQMVMEMEDIERASTMISALSRMLRFAARRGDIVSVQDEVKHVSDYLYIQQMRFGSRCDYDIQMEEGISQYYTPKFILQPIVENAVRHVVEKTNSPTRLSIEIQKKESGIQFSVTDNGQGITKERLNHMIQQLMSGEKSEGIGLQNVHSRVRLQYAEPYGIEITSEEGEGTRVVVLIPFLN
jgi:two-component system, sensor histidine kinase YesM